MFQLENTLISEEILEEAFMCDLEACKGACCVEGTAGAPLEPSELPILDQIYTAVFPYLPEAGKAALEAQGPYVKGADGDWETPLVDGKECAYTFFDDTGKAHCGIERAYKDGAVDWPKPVSCHLYPVRVQKYAAFEAVNYHRWNICSAACSLGKKNAMPIYQFTKAALIRKFGEDWYNDLEGVAKELQKQKQ